MASRDDPSTDGAGDLARGNGDALDQGNVGGNIASLSRERANPLGQAGGHHVAGAHMLAWHEQVEPDRRARRRVPEERWKGMPEEGRDRGHDGHGHDDENRWAGLRPAADGA